MTGQRPTDHAFPPPGYCRYAAEVLLPLLRQLETELGGVVQNDDIEYVHQSRVATRRIRAALKIFAECFPPGTYTRWDRQIKRLTRSLGEARDLDVQIAYIKSYIADLVPCREDGLIAFTPPGQEPRTGIVPATQSPSLPEDHPLPPVPVRTRFLRWITRIHPGRRILSLPSSVSSEVPSPSDAGLDGSLHSCHVMAGLECLLLRLTQHREEMQPRVAGAATRFIDDAIIETIARELHQLKIQGAFDQSDDKSRYPFEQALNHTMLRVAELFWYESSLADSSKVSQHHAMRIAAKRLRYTLESYSGIFESRLKGEIKVIKRIQELLGDIHDCDVWTEFLPRFLKEEKDRSVAYFGNDRVFSLILPGIHQLMDDRATAREGLFREMGTLWERLREEKFWDDLMATLSGPAQGGAGGASPSDLNPPSIIALISDIHANLPALEAVLKDARHRGATLVLNAGDLIGYGPFPDEVISAVRKNNILSVCGNYDLAILSKKWKKKSGSGHKRMAMRWAYHNISPDNRSWLKKLPRELWLPVHGSLLQMTHGSPASVTEYLDNGTPETRLKEIAKNCGAMILVTGHSHRPSARLVDGVWFINTGSVGRSEDGDPRACYALLRLHPLSIMHIRVPYDIEQTVSALKHRHLPDSFSRIVREGRSLEVVTEPDDLP